MFTCGSRTAMRMLCYDMILVGKMMICQNVKKTKESNCIPSWETGFILVFIFHSILTTKTMYVFQCVCKMYNIPIHLFRVNMDVFEPLQKYSYCNLIAVWPRICDSMSQNQHDQIQSNSQSLKILTDLIRKTKQLAMKTIAFTSNGMFFFFFLFSFRNCQIRLQNGIFEWFWYRLNKKFVVRNSISNILPCLAENRTTLMTASTSTKPTTKFKLYYYCCLYRLQPQDIGVMA